MLLVDEAHRFDDVDRVIGHVLLEVPGVVRLGPETLLNGEDLLGGLAHASLPLAGEMLTALPRLEWALQGRNADVEAAPLKDACSLRLLGPVTAA